MTDHTITVTLTAEQVVALARVADDLAPTIREAFEVAFLGTQQDRETSQHRAYAVTALDRIVEAWRTPQEEQR